VNYIPPRRSDGTIQTRRPQQAWPSNRPFRVLSIDGGGICGILPASVLAELEQRFLGGQSVARHFDMIAGTSTGGIIALGLAHGLTAKTIRDFYLQRGAVIFPPPSPIGRLMRWLRQKHRYVYERGPLEDELLQIFGDAVLGQACTRLCIPAFEGRHGEPWIFKTPHLEFETVADRPILDGMDGVAALLDELDERIAIRTEQPLRLAVNAQLLEPESVWRMGRLLAVIVGIRLLEIAGRLARCLAPLRGRRARIVRGLRRQIELVAQCRVLRLHGHKPLAQSIDPRQQPRDQRVLLGARQCGRIKGRSHPYVDSYSPARSHRLHAHRVNLPHMPYRRPEQLQEKLRVKRKHRNDACFHIPHMTG
jgi:hypothetical protein